MSERSDELGVTQYTVPNSWQLAAQRLELLSAAAVRVVRACAGIRAGMPASSVAMDVASSSLLRGWVPTTLQIIAACALLLAIGRRSRRWRVVWLPVAVVAGVALALGARWYLTWAGLAGRPAPLALWVWLAVTGISCGTLLFGRLGRRRGAVSVSAVALSLSLLCVALTVNAWTGYASTIQIAWYELADRPLPGEIDEAAVAAMKQRGDKPQEGSVVSVSIPSSGSGFPHRRELVYLPPAWYATNPAPRLPVLMMIGGEFGAPADWLYAGEARKTITAFAADHHGVAPILVFVDAAGAFANDTECVDGRRGNAADHLTEEVVPFVVSHFGASPDPANWGVVGWSMGGTCAITLAVKYPQSFGAFIDIDGDLYPNAGDRTQTVARLFDGHVDRFAAFDPSTVIRRHGRYTGLAGQFVVSGSVATGPPVGAVRPQDTTRVAPYLCQLAAGFGVECSVVSQPGEHEWHTGAVAFATALPWIAGKVGTPGVPLVPLPGAHAH